MRRRVIAATLGIIGLAGVTSACGTSSATKAPHPTVTVPSCASFHVLASKPDRCLTTADRAKLAATKKLAAKQASARAAADREAAAAKRAAAKAAQKKAAARAAAAVAAANAWHKGYLGPGGENLDVYGRWRTDLPCASYATYGCLHFEAIAENGCKYLEIDVNETQNGAIVGNIVANQLNVPPKTPVILELDADRSGIGSSTPTITCTNY